MNALFKGLLQYLLVWIEKQYHYFELKEQFIEQYLMIKLRVRDLLIRQLVIERFKDIYKRIAEIQVSCVKEI
jgi:hypothetical protein